jgi:hypothetical protein
VIVEGHVRLLLTKKLRRNCHLAARQNVPRSVPVPPRLRVPQTYIRCGETVRNSKGMELRDRFLSPGGQVLTKQNGSGPHLPMTRGAERAQMMPWESWNARDAAWLRIERAARTMEERSHRAAAAG